MVGVQHDSMLVVDRNELIDNLSIREQKQKMFTANNQIIIEDLYDDTTQPPEEDIIEYAEYIGINPKEEPELMWIARQGVKAPLPQGWKAIHDLEQNELYYFNFDTGESIWDHPCDNDFKELVLEQRKLLKEKGRENYKPPTNFDMSQRQASPTRLIKNGDTLKSTGSTTSGFVVGGQDSKLRNTSTHSLQRPELALYDTREIDFDEVNRININNDDEPDYDGRNEAHDDDSASWNNKDGREDDESSGDSGGFRKPVDFGIDKETSAKLDKLNVMLMVGAKEQLLPDSAPTTSREPLDSPTRNHVKSILGQKFLPDENGVDPDLRRSLTEDKSLDISTVNAKEFQNNLPLFKQSLEREFDQKRLELLEEKDQRIKKLTDEIEKEINRVHESERRRLMKEHEDKLSEIRRRNERELESEKEQLRKMHEEKLNQMNVDFEREKQSRRDKFMAQMAKYLASGADADQGDEKKEIAMYFEYIEKKFAQKLDERKRETQSKYEKKLKDLDDELRQQFEKEAEKKENEIRVMKEKNLMVENYDKELEKIMNERLKDFKEKENQEMNKIKEDYEIRIKTFRDKYKQLEENEFSYLENEYNKMKDKLHDEYNMKISNLEMKLKSKQGLIDKQEDNLRKRMDIIQERRRNFDTEWSKLNEEERKLSEKRESVVEKQHAMALEGSADQATSDDLKLKYEIERLKLEKADLESRLASMQRLIEKINENLNSESRLTLRELNRLDHSLDDSSVADSDKFMAKVNSVNSKLGRDFIEDDEEDDSPLPPPPTTGSLPPTDIRRVYEDIAEEDEEAGGENSSRQPERTTDDVDDDDDDEIKELVKQAKLKLRLKYYEARKRAQIDAAVAITSISSDSTDDEDDANLKKVSGDPEAVGMNDAKRGLMDDLVKEKDALIEANELLEKYKHSLIKRKLKLECEQDELRNDELAVSKIKSNEKAKQQYVIEERKLMLEKEALELEQLGLNIKTAKRLMKQKKVQLKLLEHGILEAGPIVSSKNKPNGSSEVVVLQKQTESSPDDEDDDYSDQLDQNTITNSRAESINNSAINNDQKNNSNTGSGNFSSLIYRLKFNSENNPVGGANTGLNMEKLTPILKKIPKLNQRLQLTFENMKSTRPTLGGSSSVADLVASSSSSLPPSALESNSLKREIQLIDEKWRKYLEQAQTTNSTSSQFLATDLASKINFFQNIGNQKIETDRGPVQQTIQARIQSGSACESQSRFYTAKIINGAWEKSPAYQKLTYEAGQKLLDQKWNQYIGYLSQSAAATTGGSQNNISNINNARLSKTLNALASASAVKKPFLNQPHHVSTSMATPGYVTAYATTITLPASTQSRLNQHREWIRKFKADVDLNNNSLNNKI